MTAKIIRMPRRGRGPVCVTFAPDGPEHISAARFRAELDGMLPAFGAAPSPRPINGLIRRCADLVQPAHWAGAKYL